MIGKNLTAKAKMNILLILFGVIAIVVVLGVLGYAMKYILGKSIEDNVRSDLRGFTDKQNAYNYAFSKINEQIVNTVEIHFKIRVVFILPTRLSVLAIPMSRFGNLAITC